MSKWEPFIGSTIEQVLNFLSNLYDKSVSHSAIVSERRALPIRMTLASCELLNGYPPLMYFITRVYNLKSPAPNLSFKWDVSIIFQYFENCGHNGKLSHKIFTQKFLLFLLFLGGQRVQNLLTFLIDKMIINNILVSFVSAQPQKHSRNQSKLNAIEYRAYDKRDLSVVACLKEYLGESYKWNAI